MRIQTVFIYTCAVKPVTIVKSLTETCSQTEHNIFNLFCRVRLSLKIEPKASSSNLNGKASSRSRESISGEYWMFSIGCEYWIFRVTSQLCIMCFIHLSLQAYSV